MATRKHPELRLGKNAGFYVHGGDAGSFAGELGKKHGKRRAKTIVSEANGMAREYRSRLIRLEHLLVKEGRITEEQFGSSEVESIRRGIMSQRGVGGSKAKVQRTPRPPRPRQKRKKAS